MAQAETVTVREFVEGALARSASGDRMVRSMALESGPVKRAYAEGVNDGMKEALEHVLAFIDQEDQRAGDSRD